jgi:hypothetical protein
VADHQVGVAAAQPHLHRGVRQPGGDLGGRVGQRLEQRQPHRRLQGVAEQFGGPGGVGPARGGRGGEVRAERFEIRRQIHEVTMTSLMTSVKRHGDFIRVDPDMT